MRRWQRVENTCDAKLLCYPPHLCLTLRMRHQFTQNELRLRSLTKSFFMKVRNCTKSMPLVNALAFLFKLTLPRSNWFPRNCSQLGWAVFALPHSLSMRSVIKPILTSTFAPPTSSLINTRWPGSPLLLHTHPHFHSHTHTHKP